MPAALKILATPIGNIRDITLRAIDELKTADILLAEDTRHTKNLLQALGISLKPSARLISCNAHRERERAELVGEFLQQNLNVVLVSDAGTPAISDPGSLLVQAIVAAGFLIQPIPGCSALSASLMGAGIDTTRFAFLGFLPKKKSSREKIILKAADANLALFFYESPLRVLDLLQELFNLLGPRRVVVARELTKLFETFHRGVLGSPLSPDFIEKGECVVVIEAGELALQQDNKIQQDISDFINSSNLSSKDLAKLLVQKFKLKKKDAYNLVLASRSHLLNSLTSIPSDVDK
jgi:16S rRNA (cytidine1402-2'-O)-methyltransferase